ncbi:MAG: hypothetical protein IT328_27765, partial [Caldilineaceae bacterium]|nr:hypothetical protein [Caldilineaceae bacterium]
MKSIVAQRRIATITAMIFALSLLLGCFLRPIVTSAATPDAVTAAWERARAAGSYAFTGDVTQVTL